MSRATKTWTISLPPKMVKEAEKIARDENRTKSELIREALRFYLDEKNGSICIDMEPKKP